MTAIDEDTVRAAIRAAISAKAYLEAADIVLRCGPTCDCCHDRRAVAWDSATHPPYKYNSPRYVYYACLQCLMALPRTISPDPFYPAPVREPCLSQAFWPALWIDVLQIEVFDNHTILFAVRADAKEFAQATRT